MSPVAKAIWLCFEANRADGYVWSVRYGQKWYRAKSVTTLGVPLDTVYKPRGAQPHAYLRGLGFIRRGGRNQSHIWLSRWPLHA